MKRVTKRTFEEKKQAGEKIVMITAYDYTMAKLMDESGVDAILVGDSLGMVMLGYEDTVQVTMADMIHHVGAVRRGAQHAMVVGDLPFLSYHGSIDAALENAGALMRAGASSVKLEGGESICPKVRAMVDAGIPVMGHLGLTPQSVNQFGGFLYQGKTEESAARLLQDAKALEQAGAYALVAECVPKALAGELSKTLSIPVIGIGAGNLCDGQVLVYQDMLGMYGNFVPKFAKQFAPVGDLIRQGVAQYADEVRRGVFPAEEHTRM